MIHVYIVCVSWYTFFTYTSVSVSVTITPSSGSPTAGETYSLVCSATVSGTSDTPVPSYQWLVGPSDNRQPLNNGNSITVNSNMVQFSTLKTSHGGMYTCQVTVGDLVMKAASTVQIRRKYNIVLLIIYSVLIL